MPIYRCGAYFLFSSEILSAGTSTTARRFDSVRDCRLDCLCHGDSVNSGETQHCFHTVTNHHVSNNQQGNENERLLDSGHPLRRLAMQWIDEYVLKSDMSILERLEGRPIDSAHSLCFLISTSTSIDSFVAISFVFNYETIFSRASTSLDQSIVSSSHSFPYLSLQRLPCSFVTYALLGSYSAQAELGDHNEIDHGTSFDYLKDLQFAPIQDDELLRRIHEQHKRHRYVVT
jgi:hypothetical protein